MNILKNILLIIVFAGFSKPLFSQTGGNVKGVLKDTLKNEFIQGGLISVSGTNKSTVSNNQGEFLLDNLSDGSYKLIITASGMKKRTVTVEVSNGAPVDLGIISMDIEKNDMGTMGVRFTVKKNTEKAVVQEVKNKETVTNIISAESIAKTQDNDAAKAAARIPGVTLMESRFIMLRGLSQRYNSVQINNINAPSTEVDRRAFSFDLVPSNMLDKIAIYKSPSSDLAGDFAGGVIKLQTKNEIEKDFFTVNFGFGYRVNTSFSSHDNNTVGSGTDFLGFDNGNRSLPGSFPSTIAGISSSQAVSYGKTLKNNFSLSSMSTPMDYGFGFGFGKNIRIKKMKLFTVNNFGYSTNYQYADMKRYRYQNDQIDYVRQMFNYNDNNFAVESKFNILSNWILKVNKNTSFTFKNMFNQIGENETTIRTGVNLTERPFDEFKNYAFHYTSRSIYFGQFEGAHKLSGKGEKLSYTLGYSNVSRNEPDYRRFRTYRGTNSDAAYTLIDPPSASLFDAARFYSKLKENTVAGTISYERKIENGLDSTKDIVIRTGAYAENKNRDFNARWISYSYNGNPSNKNEFLKQPIDQIFNEGNINTAGGFKPVEGTNPSDHYTASNNLLAAYVNSTLPFGKVNLNFGVRAEYFQQQLLSATQNGPVDVNLKNLNILPSINTAYYFDDENLVRLAYGKTVNRPEFRELAPFVYYDFMYDVNIVGNPNLRSATIDNLDLRYENYPSKSETVSFGVFYKRFLNPIENYVQPVGLSQQFYLQNAKSATNMGLEVELRKSFDSSAYSFVRKLSVVLNASYIISKVDLGKDSTLSQARTRPLQGQSPYIFNLALQYRTDSGLTINLAYNIFGKRIVYVGNNIFPTVYEMPRHSVDLTITKEISKKFNVKFGVSDLLNFKHQLWQDTNNDGRIDYKKEKTDQQLLQYRRGQLISLGISYKIR
jgi:hypothetical protein